MKKTLENIFDYTIALIIWILLAAFVTAPIIIPFAALQAFVAIDLWQLFIEPWVGIKAPSLWMMAGVIVTIKSIFGKVRYKKSEKDEEEGIELLEKIGKDIFRFLVFTLMYTLSIWGFGRLLHLLASL